MLISKKVDLELVGIKENRYEKDGERKTYYTAKMANGGVVNISRAVYDALRSKQALPNDIFLKVGYIGTESESNAYEKL